MADAENRDDSRNQREKFLELARELECDEDEARFEETVRKIAPNTPSAPGKDRE